METRVRAPKFDYIIRKGFRFFQVLNNYEHHSNGRLWVIWNKESLRITALSSGNQWIHIQVEDLGCVTFQASFVYGLNFVEGRYDLWTFLQHIRPHHPWVCLGDFNCVREVEERISDTVPNLQVIDDFNEAVYGAGLDDLLTHGCKYTWTNKQEDGDRKWMKLDRVLVNSAWQTSFTSSYADALAAGVSDHSPLVVWVTPDEPSRPKQFRLVNHLKLIKPKLKSMHQRDFSNISGRVKDAKLALQRCQLLLQQTPLNAELLSQEKNLS
ncbi:uncharacterized protein LOC141607846 [Silene latifolia]|uniref:uncharacterized protein LOC141607846 n=1 Tax=Silene latifolia TaxID=37657 RepID=UPI003D78931A